ncbi:MAG: cyclic nucleotide-binding/CBS domain-containing protein [Thermoleophilia bacterium]|jgi:CBS domain-containing protein
MRVEDAMTPVSAIVGPDHTLRQAARRMVRNHTGAAVVMDGALPGPAMITERDLLRAVAAGLDPEAERVEEHMTQAIVTAAPAWPIGQAAMVMVKHGVRHVLVFDGSELVGVLSMRDVVRHGGLEPLTKAVTALSS